MDKTKNFVVGQVVIAPSPATTGTSITVSNESLFPDPATFGAYNLCVWSQTGEQTPTTCEIVRVVAKVTSGDNAVLTVARSQEGTSGLSIAAGWKAYYSLTQKYFDDLETAVGDAASAATTAAGYYTNTSFTDITASGATNTISIANTSTKRYKVSQTASACTYTLTPSQAGLVWYINLTKTATYTVAFDANVTMDKAVDAAWTDVDMVFIAVTTSDIRGYVLSYKE